MLCGEQVSSEEVIGSLAHAMDSSRKLMSTFLLRRLWSLEMIIIYQGKISGESLVDRQVKNR